MLPENCLEELKKIFGRTFNSFNKDEVLILATALLENSVNNARIQLMVAKHSSEITNILRGLVEKKALIEDGYGKGKTYNLNNDYTKDGAEDLEITKDEMKIIEYIEKHGSINNQMSREELKFGKYKNIALFNSLIKKDRIQRVGESSSTRYILKN